MHEVIEIRAKIKIRMGVISSEILKKNACIFGQKSRFPYL
jgi:hypothetical protein